MANQTCVRILLAAAVTGVISGAITQPLQAANSTWNGSTDNLVSNAGNWSAGAPGVLGLASTNVEIATFGAEAGATPDYLVNFDGTRSLGGFVFNTGSQAYSVSGSDLRLNSGTAVSLATASGITSTISIANNLSVYSNATATTNATYTIQNLTNTATGFGTLTLSGNITVHPSVTTGTSGSRTLSLNGGATAVAAGLASASVINLTGTISDQAGPNSNVLSIRFGTNSGIFRISGANTYSGTSSILAGLTLLGSNTALGTSTVALDAGFIAADGATARSISNTWRNLADATTTFGSASTINSASSFGINNSNTGKLTFSGPGTLGRATSGAKTFSYFTDNEFSGVISQDAALGANITGITINGNVNNTTAVMTFSGANTFDKPVTLNNAILAINTIGNVGAATGTSLGLASTAANGQINFAGANSGTTLRYTGLTTTTDRTVSLNTTSQAIIEAAGTGPITFTSPLAIGGTLAARTLTLSGANTGDNTFSGTIANPTGFATGVVKSGTGTWVLGNSNSYTGITTINDGVLKVGSLADGGGNSSIGSAAVAANNLVISSTGVATLRYTGGATSTNRLFTVGTPGATIESSGTGALSFTSTSNVSLSGTNTARTITLGGTNTGANTLRPGIGNNGTGATSLTKVDAGTWNLTGTSTFTGATNINAGRLNVGVGGVGALGNTAVSVNNTATLGGSGTIGGSVTVGSTATLAPGDSPGKLTVAGNASLGGIYEWEFDNAGTVGTAGTNYDQLALSGATSALALGGSLNVKLTTGNYAGTFWDTARQFKIVDFTDVTNTANTTHQFTGGITSAVALGGEGSFTTSLLAGADAGDVQLNWVPASSGASITLTNTIDNANVATVGEITVFGSNNSYASEIDPLTIDAAVVGSAPVSSIGDEAGTNYVMFWTDGNNVPVNVDLGGGTFIASGGVFSELQGVYPGFDFIVSYANFTGEKVVNFNLTGAVDGSSNPVTFDQIAIVPEPGTLAAVAMGTGALGLFGRRRRHG